MILINKDRKGLFFFTVKSGNGKILCHSESYTRKENCIQGAMALVYTLKDGQQLIDKTNGVKK